MTAPTRRRPRVTTGGGADVQMAADTTMMPRGARTDRVTRRVVATSVTTTCSCGVVLPHGLGTELHTAAGHLVATTTTVTTIVGRADLVDRAVVEATR